MNFLSKYKKTSILVITLFTCIFIFTTCISNQDAQNPQTSSLSNAQDSFKTNITYAQFAGSQVCGNCHKEIYNDYTHTTHYITSRIADKNSIAGDFTPGKNHFQYTPENTVALEKRGDSFYQVGYYKGEERLARRFNFVIGSGVRGQTYLSWYDKQLIELPVSYFTEVHQWANSPGYPRYPVIFNRPATTRCMECHSTFAAMLTPPMQEPEKFDSTKMILSVGCEKCHGPAAKHVAFETAHSGDTTGMYIINPSKLTTALSINVCALCHAGRLQKTKPSFQFTAGDTLANYFANASSNQNTSTVDVHGNQLTLLKTSKCFQFSKSMTCITCHDPHKNERGKTELFSQHCMSCHTDKHKPVEGAAANMLVKNCIDCHMPEQKSMSIIFLLQDQEDPVHALMRTHLITVYPDETKKFIERYTSQQKKKS